MTDDNERLPDHLLKLARSLKLYVTTSGQVAYTSAQGAGIDLDRWLTMYDGEICIEATIERIGENSEPISKMQMMISDPIDEASAVEVLHRWAVLQCLESEHDGKHDDPATKKQREDTVAKLMQRLMPPK